MYKGLLEKYKEYLPVTDKTPMISLAEGNTPLIPLPNLSKNWVLLYTENMKA